VLDCSQGRHAEFSIRPGLLLIFRLEVVMVVWLAMKCLGLVRWRFITFRIRPPGDCFLMARLGWEWDAGAAR